MCTFFCGDDVISTRAVMMTPIFVFVSYYYCCKLVKLRLTVVLH